MLKGEMRIFIKTHAILAHWVHDLDPFVVQFSNMGPFEGIRWYGLAYLGGFLVAAGLLYFYHKKNKFPLDFDQQTTLMCAIMIGVLVGGRLGYMLLYALPEFLHNPLLFFRIWGGGMASHGGFIGVILAMYWFSRKYRYNPWMIADAVATVVPPGFFFGRIANFINGELYGKITSVSWGVIFPQSASHAYYPVEAIVARHPSQLYEALLEGLILFIYLQWRFWSKDELRTKSGQISGEFLLFYAIFRIFCEQFKEPDASLFFGLSRGTVYSLIIGVAGLLIILFRRKASRA